MRYLVCLLLGLMIGAIGATTAANILARRDAYPKALMGVMHHELETARKAAQQKACTDDGHAMTKLALLANDIHTAMPDNGSPDRVFDLYTRKLAEAVDAAATAECPQRTDALTRVSNACDDCHRDYR
jgi:hypothetical protein